MFQIIIYVILRISTLLQLESAYIFSSVIRDWNDLPIATRQLNMVNTFHTHTNSETITVPKFYYEGNRKHKSRTLANVHTAAH